MFQKGESGEWGPLPFIRDQATVLYNRCLAEHEGIEYWSRIYDGGDVIYKQATFDLAEREAFFLSQLKSPLFPRVLESKSEPLYSIVVMEKIAGTTLLEATDQIHSSPEALHSFIQACLKALELLAQNKITHRDIRPDNILVREGSPVLIDLGWAVSPAKPCFIPQYLGGLERPPDGTFCDVYSMGKVIQQLNQHRYETFDHVIELMIETNAIARMTDLQMLHQLFEIAMRAQTIDSSDQVVANHDALITALLKNASFRNRQISVLRSTTSQHLQEKEQAQNLLKETEQMLHGANVILDERQQALLLVTSEREKVQREVTEREKEIGEINAKREKEIGEIGAKLTETLGRVSALELQLQEAHRKLSAKQRMIEDVNAKLAGKERLVAATAATLAQNQLQLEKLRKELSTNQQTIEDVNAKLVEKEQLISSFELQAQEAQKELVTKQGMIEALTAQLAQKEEEIKNRDLQLQFISSGTGWAFLKALWRVRLWFAPGGSRRERWMHLLLGKTRPGTAVTNAAQPVTPEKTEPVRKGNWNQSIRARVPYRVRRLLTKMVPGRSYSSATLPASEATHISDAPVPETETQLPAWSEGNHSSTYDIIVFPIIDWDFRFQRPQQIAVRFAESGHRVFYLNTRFHEGQQPGFRMIRQNILEVMAVGPTSLNLYTDSMEKDVADSITEKLASCFRELSVKEAICIVDLPFWSPIASGLRERFGWKVVYDCMDWHVGFSTNGQKMLDVEQKFSSESDLVLTSSRKLYANHAPLNPRCIFVPNAVDFDHFHFTPETGAEELANLQTPIIGYYGAISDWFDSDLIQTLAKRKPRWNFVLIGRTFGADLRPLRGLKNVHLIDEKPYTSLPAYFHRFDVCIIPFKKTPLTEATNPVKLFEYLSAGKKVVATNLDELSYYGDYIKLASTADEWLDAIEESLNHSDPELRENAIDFARQNTWHDRGTEIKHQIDQLHPKVSIIVVTWNNLEYNKLCLQSIFSKTGYPNYEVIVVDNYSSDGTLEFLMDFARTHPQVKVISNNVNRGFAAANNQGIAAATGEYIVFLNNDTVVTRGWLSRLIYHLRDPEVGMVGPVTNWSGNESRIETTYESIDRLEPFAESYTNSQFGRTFEINMLALFCVITRRRVLDEVGPLDERYGIGMFEDDDYSLRVKQKGYKIICAEDVFIHHWGRATFSKLADEEYRGLFDKNRRKFEEKWNIKWEPHQYRTW